MINKQKILNTKIGCKNGVFNLKTNKLEPITPNNKPKINVPFNYDPDAKCPNFEKILSETFTPEGIVEFQKMCGLYLVKAISIEDVRNSLKDVPDHRKEILITFIKTACGE